MVLQLRNPRNREQCTTNKLRGVDQRSEQKPVGKNKSKKTLAQPTEVPMTPPTSPAASKGRPDALRNFMARKRIKPLRWAQDAGVEPGRLYGFLQGQITRLSPDEEQRLASSANVSVETLYPGVPR